MRKLAIVAVAVLTAVGNSLPAAAFPVPEAVAVRAVTDGDVQQVRTCSGPHCKPAKRPPHAGKPNRPPPHHANRPSRPPPHNSHRPSRPPPHNSHRPRPPQNGWYNGHRGYRDYRYGYRRGNDGWWYPLAAFGTGLIIGGAVASQPSYAQPSYSYGNAHVQWCYNRYKTYREYDNTYAPSVGVRAQCVSPY